MSAPPTASDLIFSELANHKFSKTLGDIKRHTLSIHNRLESILTDSTFVNHVADIYQRPLVANERCGSWYVDPSRKDGSAYFKSTDGHTGVWKFNTRRLNTHLLELIGSNDGCIIVDSTRRGKRMPDALSKTIPIWCCVLNRTMFADLPDLHGLYTPPQVVSASEHSQILSLIDEHVESFLALQLDMPSLRKHVTKPLRPIWVTPESHLPDSFDGLDAYHSIICCTSSRRVIGGEVSEGGYIQGSGDDTENWAFGLTPSVFWTNKSVLLSTPESESPNLISTLMQTAALAKSSLQSSEMLVPPTDSLYLSALSDLAKSDSSRKTIRIILRSEVTPSNEWQKSPTRLEVGLGTGKIGSRNLRPALHSIIEFVKQSLRARNTEKDVTDISARLVISCVTGKDYSAGLAVVLLCLLYDDDGSLSDSSCAAERNINKLYIRRRLGWITTAIPDANPSRSTLQSVNSYLM